MHLADRRDSMVQPAVTVRSGDRSNTSLMFGVVLAAVAIHRLSVWGILDLTIIMPDAVAGANTALTRMFQANAIHWYCRQHCSIGCCPDT